VSQIKWITVAELILDTGTERFSAERVRKVASESPPTAEVIYSGTVLQWGSVHKSIPLLPGLPQISDAQIRIADNYRKWRDLLAKQTPRRRLIRLTVLPEGASLAAYTPIFVGEVVSVVFTPAAIQVSLRDRMFAWLDEPIPAMAITSLYPDLAPKDQGQFIPIIQGQVRSVETSPSTAEGVIPLPHIGFTPEESPPASPPASRDRYAVAVHPVSSVVAIYRREQIVNDDDMATSEWVVVDPAEYEITTGFFAEDDNPFGRFEMTHTYLDFYGQQPEGTEIRADVDGIDFRGIWGDLPEAEASPPGGALRNPIDFFIGMTYLICQKAGISVNVFDTDEIGALREVFEGLGLYCDGAITEEITARDFLAKFLRDFHLDMFVNRRGLITLRYVTEESPTRTVYVEGKHILRGSFMEWLPEKIVNQIDCRYAYNNATGKHDAGFVQDNATEQEVLNLPQEESPSSPEQKIEREVLELTFIRDADTAQSTVDKRMEAQQLGTYQQELELPLPQVVADMELAQLIGLTHSMGLDLYNPGYINQEVKTLSLLFDLDRLKVRARTVLSVAADVDNFNVNPDVERVRPTIAEIIDVGPPYDVYHVVSGKDSAIDYSEYTYALGSFEFTSSFAEYNQLALYGVPEPRANRTLTAVKLGSVVEYIWDNPNVSPISVVDVRKGAEYSRTGAAYFTYQAAFLFGGEDEAAPKQLYEADLTPAEWESAFPGGASEVHFRMIQWHSFSSQASIPNTHLRWYDAWVEYHYAPL